MGSVFFFDSHAAWERQKRFLRHLPSENAIFSFFQHLPSGKLKNHEKALVEQLGRRAFFKTRLANCSKNQSLLWRSRHLSKVWFHQGVTRAFRNHTNFQRILTIPHSALPTHYTKTHQKDQESFISYRFSSKFEILDFLQIHKSKFIILSKHFLSSIRCLHLSSSESSLATSWAPSTSFLGARIGFERCAFRRRKRHAHGDSWRRRAGSGDRENPEQGRANNIPGLPVMTGPL